MLTMPKMEYNALQSALKRLEKCGGDCNHCKKCHVYTASAERAIYMAVGCDALPENYRTPIANGQRSLHGRAVEVTQFELEGVTPV